MLLHFLLEHMYLNLTLGYLVWWTVTSRNMVGLDYKGGDSTHCFFLSVSDGRDQEMTCSFSLKRSYVVLIYVLSIVSWGSLSSFTWHVCPWLWKPQGLQCCFVCLWTRQYEEEGENCGKYQTRAGKCYWEAQHSISIVFRYRVLYLFLDKDLTEDH